MEHGNATRRGFLTAAALGMGAPLVAGTAEAGMLTPPRPARQAPYRVGKWLPSDREHLRLWLADLKTATDAEPLPLHPTVAAFQTLIETTPDIYMFFHQMFEQLPNDPYYEEDPTGAPQVRDYKTMLAMINRVLRTAPEFNTTGLVGFPINAILDWPMGTPGGFAAFLDERVNAHLKAILNAWGDYLKSPASASVLNEDPLHGWFGAAAKKAMPTFDEDFICDPKAPHHGFESWDTFFTRLFRPGRRPVGAPGDDSVVVNACESAPYRIARNVKAVDRFWIKSQPYSLSHMFGGDPVHEAFAGGTVYQAFLSALSYHRWHAPVSGRVVKTGMIDGSYYSEPPAIYYDPSAPNESQGYITEVAARGYIIIEADNPKIGLMAFLAVGMAEVSTCEITVTAGQRIKKGDEIGMFHFGGSTHCLFFRPEVKIAFDLGGQEPGLDSHNINLVAPLARVG
jgi:phosphatidylserine decarboxylase